MDVPETIKSRDWIGVGKEQQKEAKKALPPRLKGKVFHTGSAGDNQDIVRKSYPLPKTAHPRKVSLLSKQ
jgi:hypothetical protein